MQSNNLANLDKFLENEKKNNSEEPWSKLDKTARIRKLTTYAENYAIENELTEEECNALIAYFRDCLDKKKLQRVKDVVYEKETGKIKEIPGLFYNKSSHNFTIKNNDKRVSTIKSLTPKKKNSTIKATKDSDSD